MRYEHNYENCHNYSCRKKCEADGYRKAVEEMKSKICMYFADWQLSETDEQIRETIESAIKGVEEMANALMKGKCDLYRPCKTYMDKYDNDMELWKDMHGYD